MENLYEWFSVYLQHQKVNSMFPENTQEKESTTRLSGTLALSQDCTQHTDSQPYLAVWEARDECGSNDPDMMLAVRAHSRRQSGTDVDGRHLLERQEQQL